ncbi:NAD(P)H-binding protein [Wenzhouxiangella sp. AB-CW3]|uniref:NmrA family NAD(P)-binding protein n=1 Tax=Wenzhouxiangella sp. AB-CW3 TaxID=2771012 RepID=UPI00168AC024|nr:NAD(P)H-binding protein [Wenzhouxiangella sp. AB-CW3]QOC21434.1 NAD(P)H-binding protein [Wenzhouxiangella sp. AB-CW3]
MTVSKLLVFGATGVQGHPVVDVALEQGLEVRASTRDRGEAEEKLPASVDIVEADFTVADDVNEAMEGVDAVYFYLPTMPDRSHARAIIDNVLEGAARQGLQRIVFTTGGCCGDNMPSCGFVDGLRSISDRILSAEVPAVVLRPTLYLANLVWPHLIREIRDYGKLTYPPLARGRRMNWTATEDQALLAVASLTADVAGEAIDIASPEPVTPPELCRMLASAYGREVHFAPQGIDDFADTLSHLFDSAELGRMVAELYAAMDRIEGDGPLVDTDALESRFGVRLTPVSEWVDDRLGRLLQLYG